MNRRDFLRGTAACAVAAVAPMPVLAEAPLAAPYHVAGGAGGIWSIYDGVPIRIMPSIWACDGDRILTWPIVGGADGRP